uniref:Uncharacterized protein n=1 Tax=Spermophilus dauricus TaxID=99837 RepID=A0A8C9PID0_SPEDA
MSWLFPLTKSESVSSSATGSPGGLTSLPTSEQFLQRIQILGKFLKVCWVSSGGIPQF